MIRIPRLTLACWTLLLAAVSTAIAEVPVLDPAQLNLDPQQLGRIDAMVEKEIEAKNLPGCVVAIGRTGGIGFLKAYGRRQIKPTDEPMTVDTVFDMASLTKPIACATSVMILVERGDLRLRNPVAEYIPEFGENGKDDITVEDLLVHRGGLIPDNSMKDYAPGVDAWERIFALEAKKPEDRTFIYSDMGFIVLGALVERVSGKSVAAFAKENIFQPLGMNETGYNPAQPLRRRAAPTEKQNDHWLRGTVHDPRAAALGGVAGHAGLFSTAHDLAIYCDAMLRGARAGEDTPRVMSRATLAEMLRPREVGRNRRALGWDSRSSYSSNRGETFSDRAFGHGGFTGTAMWIDPELDLFVIFLSNRLHPDGKGSVNQLAGRIGAIAAAAIRGPNPLPSKGGARGGIEIEKAQYENPSPNLSPGGRGTEVSAVDSDVVLNGIDVLVRDDFKQLKGRKVGLITNHTGVSRDGKRTIDLLHEAPDVELVAIFSPEHGIGGTLDRDGITDVRDEATNLPVYSLYGETRRPTEEHLKGIDTLVFDIQDIGARFYTYMSTMAWCLEEAAKRDLRYVVLDRPNPIGGVAVAGPVLDAGRENFVGFHTLPVQHGMTVGELAKLFHAEKVEKGSLTVIPVENWRRGDLWDATGLMWINPSPNMRNLHEALYYPGIGLLETTNISVGRGTDTPFEVLGAPWIDARELARELNAAGIGGVRFVPIEFTPDASKFAGEKCGGVNITMVDRRQLEPVAMGLEIARTLRRLYGDKWEVAAMDRLLINREVLEAIRDGATTAQLDALIQPKLDEFIKRRSKHLLYVE
jgi:uncharacterized protein YbbC (DUF1343 family)/CubicO group peptidase (beta-lactamase class C family)